MRPAPRGTGNGTGFAFLLMPASLASMRPAPRGTGNAIRRAIRSVRHSLLQ